MTQPIILTVDDNTVARKVVRMTLFEAGYHVVEAQDAETALVAIGRHRPDLVLLDVHMPGTDGLDLTRQLKSDPATRAIVVVALTAGDTEAHRQQALAAGCDGYIAKPIDARTFPTEVASFLRLSSAGNAS